MLTIRKLIWDSWNASHIARHQVTPEEVEIVCHKEPFVFRGKQKSRVVLVGMTEEKRILTVVLEPKKDKTYYPITAYRSSRQEVAIYKRLRGGEHDEK